MKTHYNMTELAKYQDKINAEYRAMAEERLEARGVHKPALQYIGWLGEYRDDDPGPEPSTRAQWEAYAEDAGISTDGLPTKKADAVAEMRARA